MTEDCRNDPITIEEWQAVVVDAIRHGYRNMDWENPITENGLLKIWKGEGAKQIESALRLQKYIQTKVNERKDGIFISTDPFNQLSDDVLVHIFEALLTNSRGGNSSE